jgi:hypothetical protein
LAPYPDILFARLAAIPTNLLGDPHRLRVRQLLDPF